MRKTSAIVLAGVGLALVAVGIVTHVSGERQASAPPGSNQSSDGAVGGDVWAGEDIGVAPNDDEEDVTSPVRRPARSARKRAARRTASAPLAPDEVVLQIPPTNLDGGTPELVTRSLDESVDPVDRAIAEQAKEAYSVIEVEPEMRLGEKYDLTLLVERSGRSGIDALISATPAPAAPVGGSVAGAEHDPVQSILITGMATARAYSSRLKLTPTFEPGMRRLRSGAPTVWMWIVEPEVAGDATVTVELLQEVEVGGERQHVTVQYFPRAIEVTVPEPRAAPPPTAAELASQQMASELVSPPEMARREMDAAVSVVLDDATDRVPKPTAQVDPPIAESAPETEEGQHSGAERLQAALEKGKETVETGTATVDAGTSFLKSLNDFLTSLSGLITSGGTIVTSIAAWSIWRGRGPMPGGGAPAA